MFKNLIRKIKRVAIYDEKSDYTAEDDGINTLKEDVRMDFERKIVYKRNNKIDKFPLKHEKDGYLAYFEKDKYLDAAKEVYDLFGIGEYIKAIEITDNIDCSGQCFSDTKSEKLQITIQIHSKELGIIVSGGYIHKYSKERCKKFVDIFAHELVHAKNKVDIVEKYGIDEYKALIDETNKVSKMAWKILDEYIACREVAKNFNSYDSTERIDNYTSGVYKNINEIINNKEKSITIQSNIDKLNYAIATRCAFADESGNDAEHLEISSYIYGHEKFRKYVNETRRLLNEYYDLKPLNKASYQEMGDKMMYELLSIYGVKKENMDGIIQYLI